MFELYTEKARRVIFFARHGAMEFGSPFIETEHLLMGLLREAKATVNRYLSSEASQDSIRAQIELNTTQREKVSTSVDLPLSNECKRVLAYAAEEAHRLAHKFIGTEHLLLGLLREEKSFAARMLRERGADLDKIRLEIAALPTQPQPEAPDRDARVGSYSPIANLSRVIGAVAPAGRLSGRGFGAYDEKARRVIFFARFEASQLGSPYIETEHLLLGLLRENMTLLAPFVAGIGAETSWREEVEAHSVKREKTSTSVDLPLSNECKRIFAYAAEEGDMLGHSRISPGHLLMGCLREEGCFAERALSKRGIELKRLRKELIAAPAESANIRVPPLPRVLLERFAQKAMSAIIFAIYEVSRSKLSEVETEHMLLGLLHEDKPMVDRLLGTEISEDSLRKQMETRSPAEKQTPLTLANMPLSDEGKRAVVFAAEEADRIGHQAVGTGHLLLGLLREEGCSAARILREYGADLAEMRKKLVDILPVG